MEISVDVDRSITVDRLLGSRDLFDINKCSDDIARYLMSG